LEAEGLEWKKKMLNMGRCYRFQETNTLISSNFQNNANYTI
jgi:hypothetical protein